MSVLRPPSVSTRSGVRVFVDTASYRGVPGRHGIFEEMKETGTEQFGPDGHRPTAEGALYWFVRLQADDVTDEERARFHAWRDEQACRGVEFDKLTEIWNDLDGAVVRKREWAGPKTNRDRRVSGGGFCIKNAEAATAGRRC